MRKRIRLEATMGIKTQTRGGDFINNGVYLKENGFALLLHKRLQHPTSVALATQQIIDCKMLNIKCTNQTPNTK